MIYYFSATGNSKAVAEVLAQELGEQAVDITRTNPEPISSEENYVGFVFPIYAWAAPEAVLAFADRVKPGNAFCFAVCTFSNEAGMALQQFAEHFPLDSGYGVVMPDNFPVFDKIVETEESAARKLTAAKPRITQIAQALREKQENFDVKVGTDGQDKTYVRSLNFNRVSRKTAPFWVEADKCIHCGLCQRICPAGAIELMGTLPEWKKQSCYLCAGCLNRCPTEAIQYGNFSKGKYRYVFRGFDLSGKAAAAAEM